LETTRPKGRPRNRWQDEVREVVRIVGGEEWVEKVYNGEEWKKLLRMARNHRILRMPMEGINTVCVCRQPSAQVGGIYCVWQILG
jgi:hypothetical protein